MADPIVASFDVVLSRELIHELYMFQYPLRPANKPYAAGGVSSVQARVRPVQQQVELQMGLDMSSEHYDHGRGAQLAHEANASSVTFVPDGEVEEEEEWRGKRVVDGVGAFSSGSGPSSTSSSSTAPIMFPSGHMDSFTLRATAHPMKTHYVAGIFRKGRLTLAPLSAVMQLRPTFDHIDEATRRRRDAEAADLAAGSEAAAVGRGSSSGISGSGSGAAGAEAGGSDTAAAAAAGAPVQVVIKRRESERAMAARERSYAHLRKQREDEVWHQVKYVHASEPPAHALRARLAKTKASAGTIEFDLTPLQYLDALHTGTAGGRRQGGRGPPEDASVAAAAEAAAAAAKLAATGAPAPCATSDSLTDSVGAAGPSSMALHEIQRLAPEARVRSLLLQAHVLDMNTVHRLCGEAGTFRLAQTLDLLPSLAHLVHGCWVARSVVIYPGADGDKTAVSIGVSMTRRQLRLGRDYVLAQCSMSHHHTIRRTEVMEAASLTADLALGLLKQLCRLVPGKGWTFKGSPSSAFALEYPQRMAQLATNLNTFVRRVKADVAKMATVAKNAKEAAERKKIHLQQQQQQQQPDEEEQGEGAGDGEHYVNGSAAMDEGTTASAAAIDPTSAEEVAATAAVVDDAVLGATTATSSSMEGIIGGVGGTDGCGGGGGGGGGGSNSSSFSSSTTFSSSTPASSSSSNLASLLRAALENHGPCRVSALHAHISAEEGNSNSAITPAAISSTLAASGFARELVLAREEKKGEEEDRLFVMASLGNPETDALRDVILTLFESHPEPRLKKSDIMHACAQAGLDVPSNAVYQRLLKELATSSRSGWCLRDGTD
eukprot:UC1_evm2s716